MHEPMLMFHGTTDAVLASIMDRGLICLPPEERTSSSSDGAWSHLVSFDGIYAAISMDTAIGYAEKASSERGGEPILIAMLVDGRDFHPDEDDVIEFIGNYGEDMGRIFPVEDFAARWQDAAFRKHVVDKMSSDLIAAFEPMSTIDTEASMAHLLSALFDGRTSEDLQEAFADRGNVLAPSMLEPLLSDADGQERYRSAMDALARSMIGTGPYESMEYHKVRIRGAVGYSGRTRIVAIGTKDDLVSHYGADMPADVERRMIDEGVLQPGPSPRT